MRVFGKQRAIQVAGQEFESVRAACEHFNLSYWIVCNRLSSRVGWSVDEAFEIVPRLYVNESRGNVYFITCKSTDKSYVGITRGTVGRRWERHVKNSLDENFVRQETSLQHAIGQFGVDDFSITTLHKDCSPHDLVNLEKAEIIGRNTLYPFGYNLQLGGGLRTFGREIIVDGTKYANVREACESIIPPIHYPRAGFEDSLQKRINIVYYRLRAGWTPNEAFGIVIRHYSPKRLRRARAKHDDTQIR